MKPVSSELLKRLVLLFLSGVVVLLASCSSSDALRVRQFHLDSAKPTDRDAQMVRGEQLYRLRGAVTLEEREARFGQYYTVAWKRVHLSGEAVKIVMDYQQAATGSKVLRMSRDLPAGETSGRVEFKVTGEPYRTGGRVLAWRIRMLKAGKVIAEKRSYLWR